MPGSGILQAHRRRQAAPGHPAGAVIGRGSEFHAELAGGRWALHSQGSPRQGNLGDNAGGVQAKITRDCSRNGLTSAMSDATEVGLGERRALFGVLFGRHDIQGKALHAPSSIDTPLKTKGFLKRERAIECQRLAHEAKPTSYSRQFLLNRNSNLWVVGMTYRFVMPLGPKGSTL